MNSIYFDKKQIEDGLHAEFINFLIKQSYSEQDGVSYYNDIRIKPEDLGAIVVEWESVDWCHEFSDEKWIWVDDEHVVMKEVILPDNSIQYAIDKNHEKEIREDWEKDNSSNDGHGDLTSQCHLSND